MNTALRYFKTIGATPFTTLLKHSRDHSHGRGHQKMHFVPEQALTTAAPAQTQKLRQTIVAQKDMRIVIGREFIYCRRGTAIDYSRDLAGHTLTFPHVESLFNPKIDYI